MFSVCFNQFCFVLVLFAFVLLDLLFPLLSPEIGWEERLQNDLFFVERDVKTIRCKPNSITLAGSKLVRAEI